MEGVVSLSLPGIFAVDAPALAEFSRAKIRDAGRETERGSFVVFSRTKEPRDRATTRGEVPMPLRRDVRYAIWLLRGAAARQVLPAAKRRGGQFRRRGIGTLP